MIDNIFKKEIGPFALLFISMTAIFGSGWLFAPLYAAQIAGPAAILSWLIGAGMAIVIALTMAEVITLFPRAGGLQAIAQLTHGKLLGILTNVLMLLVCIMLPALEVRAILQYLGANSSGLITSSHTITLKGYVFAGLLLLIINAINIHGAKLTAKITSFSLILKLIAPLFILAFFLIALYKHTGLDQSNLKTFFAFEWKDIFLAISTSGIIFSFNGFNQATLFAAETKNPQRSIPFAILGSILVTALLYLAIQYVFLIALPTSYLQHGWHALQFPGDNGPFAGLSLLLGLHSLVYVIYADAFLSPLGTAFTYSSGAPRIFYALSEQSDSFPILKKLNRGGVPFYSVILSMILSFLTFLFLPNLKAMISMLVAAFVLNYSVAPLSLLTLRKSHPYLTRPFKVPVAPLMCFCALFFSYIMCYCCGFSSLCRLSVLVSITVLVACIFLVNLKQQVLPLLKHSAWFILQLFILTGLSYLNVKKMLTFTEAMFIMSLLATFFILLALRFPYEMTFHQEFKEEFR